MAALSIGDYKAILRFYDIDYSQMKTKQVKNIAENRLASKLCRCIKKVDPKNKARSIGICTDSVIRKKGLAISGFTCKKKPRLKKNRKTRKKLSKIGKKVQSLPARKRKKKKKKSKN
jgi:hypothetical protein